MDERPRPQLSQRQLEVLELAASGLSARAAAANLRLSPRTVETHLRLAREKLGAPTTLAAVAQALGPPVAAHAAGAAAAELQALVGLLAAGATVREAAAQLELSPRTAARRLADGRRAFGVRSTTALARALAGGAALAPRSAASGERERFGGGADAELRTQAAEPAVE